MTARIISGWKAWKAAWAWLVALSLDGRAQAHPQRDAQHQLWLGKRASAGRQGPRGLRKFR